MAYTPGHTGRHHAISHSWYDNQCPGCVAMTEEQEQEEQRREHEAWKRFIAERLEGLEDM